MILLSGRKLTKSYNTITEKDIKEKLRFLQSVLLPITVARGHSNSPIQFNSKLHGIDGVFTGRFQLTLLLNIPCTVWLSLAVSYNLKRQPNSNVLVKYS